VAVFVYAVLAVVVAAGMIGWPPSSASDIRD